MIIYIWEWSAGDSAGDIRQEHNENSLAPSSLVNMWSVIPGASVGSQTRVTVHSDHDKGWWWAGPLSLCLRVWWSQHPSLGAAGTSQWPLPRSLLSRHWGRSTKPATIHSWGCGFIQLALVITTCSFCMTIFHTVLILNFFLPLCRFNDNLLCFFSASQLVTVQ